MSASYRIPAEALGLALLCGDSAPSHMANACLTFEFYDNCGSAVATDGLAMALVTWQIEGSLTPQSFIVPRATALLALAEARMAGVADCALTETHLIVGDRQFEYQPGQVGLFRWRECMLDPPRFTAAGHTLAMDCLGNLTQVARAVAGHKWGEVVYPNSDGAPIDVFAISDRLAFHGRLFPVSSHAEISDLTRPSTPSSN